MALAVSSLYTSGTTPVAGNPFTSSSFTPANNSLLVVAATAEAGSGMTISGGGLTWTLQKNLQSTAGGWTTETRIWTAPVTTGSSMTITVSNVGHTIAEVLQATGHNTSTPIGATGSLDTGASGTLSNITFSLSASPASTSYIYSCTGRVVNNTSTGVTAGASWTRSANAGDGGFTGGTEYITGTTSSTVTWANIAAGDTYFGYGGAIAAVEIQAAGGGGSAYVAGQSALSFMGMA